MSSAVSSIRLDTRPTRILLLTYSNNIMPVHGPSLTMDVGPHAKGASELAQRRGFYLL